MAQKGDDAGQKGKDPCNSMIVHVPMDLEGMTLQLGKFDSVQLKQDFLFMPFGSRVIISWSQLHGWFFLGVNCMEGITNPRGTGGHMLQLSKTAFGKAVSYNFWVNAWKN